MKMYKRISYVFLAICFLTFVVYGITNFIKNTETEQEIQSILEELYTVEEPDSEEPPSEETVSEPEQNENTQPYVPYRVSTNKEVDGILKIDSINLELPIFSEMTDSNLKISCTRVPASPPPGRGVNYCIMGHRMSTYGKIFNRLNEVKIKDIITVQVKGGIIYRYEVVEIFVTKGLDTNIFKQGEEEMITIFCCSKKVPDGRLVVKGKFVEIIT